MPVAAVVFDLYGTLLNLEGMEAPIRDAGIGDAAGFVREWRRKHVEYAYLSSLAQAYRPFDELSALALEHTAVQRGVELDDARRANFMDLFRVMPAHADAAPALRALAARGIPRAVLTNGTRESAHAAVEQAGVATLLDDVLSVEDVRAFKPDPRIYALADGALRVRAECDRVRVIERMGRMGRGAVRFRVAWCNRSGGPPETLTPAPEVTLGGLDELEAFVTRAG